MEQLYLTQKKVARMISFSNYNTPSKDIFKQLNILPLNKHVVNRIGIMMYTYANNSLPLAKNNLFTTNSDVHNYTTRQKHLLHINRSNMAYTFGIYFPNMSRQIFHMQASNTSPNYL